MNFWLVKSEPTKYSWEKFLSDKETFWDGVRNFQARNNLKAMKIGDKVLFYHSNEGKEIVGVAEVSKEYFQDPTTTDSQWVAVNLKPVHTLKNPVSLERIKTDEQLAGIGLIKQQRLSVMPLTAAEFDRILLLSEED